MTDTRRLERFITYIINYPPKDGLDSVKIFYIGDLAEQGSPGRFIVISSHRHGLDVFRVDFRLTGLSCFGV